MNKTLNHFFLHRESSSLQFYFNWAHKLLEAAANDSQICMRNDITLKTSPQACEPLFRESLRIFEIIWSKFHQQRGDDARKAYHRKELPELIRVNYEEVQGDHCNGRRISSSKCQSRGRTGHSHINDHGVIISWYHFYSHLNP